MYKHGGDIYNHVNCIDFSANINLLGMPAEVKAAVEKNIDSCVHYPDVNMTGLKEALAAREQLDITNIICGNGAAELIFSIVAAVKPKKALIFAPGFHEYEQALGFFECEIVAYELKERNNFAVNSDCQHEIIEMIDDSFDIVFICNPNNPTGVLLEKDFVEKLASKCEKCNTVLVVDECFLDFVEEKEKFSVTDLICKYSKLFVLKAFTKIFAMPGIRLGYGLCSDERLLGTMRNGMQPWNVSVLAQEAGIAAASLTEFEERTRVAVNQEKKYLLDIIKKAGFKIYGSCANYIFFKANENFGKEMLDRGILVRDCSNYRGLGASFYRMAVRTHEENVRFMEALQKYTI